MKASRYRKALFKYRINCFKASFLGSSDKIDDLPGGQHLNQKANPKVLRRAIGHGGVTPSAAPGGKIGSFEVRRTWTGASPTLVVQREGKVPKTSEVAVKFWPS